MPRSRWRVEELRAVAGLGPEYLVLEAGETRAVAWDREAADRIAAGLALLAEWATANGMSEQELIAQERGKDGA